MPKTVIWAFISCFLLSVVISPLVLRVAKRIKLGQPILSYVEQHGAKRGTPTMGGFVFVVPSVIVALVLGAYTSRLAIAVMICTLAYMTVGFLDDFIKVYFKENQGLKAYQKIIAQLAVAVAFSVFNYRYLYVGDGVYLPLIKDTVYFSYWYLPFCVLVYIATTNAVNLTDGLDGLVAGSGIVYFAVFLLIGCATYVYKSDNGDVIYASEIAAVSTYTAALCGGLAAFLILNVSPAKIFMGDTGSLALGGAAASIALSLRLPLLIPIVGAAFVWSAGSVLIQVVVFKLTKGKRVFLMAPFHHHLELKGLSEPKISAIYTAATAVAGAVALLMI